MENWMGKMQEYDKRIGVPPFEGWEEREIKSQKQTRIKKLILYVVMIFKKITDWFKPDCPECKIYLDKSVDKYSNVTLTCSKCEYVEEYNDSYP